MERKTYRLEQHQIDAIEEADDLGLGGNEAEAARVLLDEGARSIGLNGNGTHSTVLRRTMRRFADASALLGLFLLGFTWLAPAEFKFVVAGPFAAAFGLYAMERAIARYEPGLSARIPWGGKA